MKTIAMTLAAFLASTAAYAADPGVTDTEIKIGDVNIMTGPAAFVGKGFSLGSKIAAVRRFDPKDENGEREVERAALMLEESTHDRVEHGHDTKLPMCDVVQKERPLLRAREMWS